VLIVVSVLLSSVGATADAGLSGVTLIFTSTLLATCSPAISVAMIEIVNVVSSFTSKPLITNSSQSISALLASQSI
jgi:hypothetical protein